MTDSTELVEALRERGFAGTHALRITSYGNHKLAVIKAVRAITRWGLKNAKDAVEGLTTITDAPLTAQAAAAKLRQAGATVEIGVGELYLYAFDLVDPRRGDQPLERIRVLGSAVALEHGQLGAWTSKTPKPITGDELLGVIDEHRRAWARAGKREAPDQLTILEQLSARDLALEARLRATDGEARRREAAVYGDWLQAQGDPRGLVAAAALALDEAGDDAARRDERQRELDRLIHAHASHLFGPGQRLLQAASGSWCGPVLDTLVLHRPANGLPLTGERIAELLAAAAGACLRSLVLNHAIDPDTALSDALAASVCAAGLRELRITGVLGLTLRGDAFVRLETLTLGGRIILGPAKLPALRALDMAIDVPLAPLAASFVELDTPALEHFSISIETHDYWDQNYGPLQSNLFSLLSQPGFARLRTLKIAGGPMLAGFAALLVRLPAIATLERIDLREASMTDPCRAELERSRARLPQLLL